MFMGRNSQSGEVVDDAAWAAFLEDTVTPRFPDGLSVLDAQGQWQVSGGVVQKERSKLLVILAPPGDDGARLIGEVSHEYKRRFGQGRCYGWCRTRAFRFRGWLYENDRVGSRLL